MNKRLNWKKFLSLTTEQKLDEANFIIGLDIGNDRSSIAFFDKARNMPELIDMSGGYGKPNPPTVMQYIPETKEWVFGEYALSNGGDDRGITISSLVDKLGKKEYVELNSNPITLMRVLGMFIKELIGSIKNINPNGEIGGIVVSVPAYISEQAKSEMLWAFKYAGYEKELVKLVTDRECIFARHYHGKELKHEKVLILDFGSRALRGGVYDVRQTEETVELKSLSSLFDPNLGTKQIDNMVYQLFREYYEERTGHQMSADDSQLQKQLMLFSYQHKDMLFQKGIQIKPARVYFNFAYPPFQINITKEQVDNKILPFKKHLIDFIGKLLEKNIYVNDSISREQISAVICTGGGFEMLWAKDAVVDFFDYENVSFYKNSKAAIAEGAAIIAADELEVLNNFSFSVIDRHQVMVDVGIKILQDKKERFVPIIEKNTFWWQSYDKLTVLLNQKTDEPVNIGLFVRDTEGDVRLADTVCLNGLPVRPAGTTKIGIKLNFNSYNQLVADFYDEGFGELFPKTSYSYRHVLNL